MQLLADQANRHLPQLRTHDRYGERIDAVDYHPAYHELMTLAFGAGLHSLAWKAKRDGAFVARAALNYLWNQAENGTACPVTMAFAAVQVMRNDAQLAAEWEPKLLADAYDPRPLHLSQKRAVTVGMAMTEKQGGSDLRSNQTVATRTGRRRVCAGRPQVVLLGADERRFSHAGAHRRRRDLFLRAAIAGRRRAQRHPHPAPEGQVRQPLQRVERNRVPRRLGAQDRRRRTGYSHPDRDGAPDAFRYRRRLGRHDARRAQSGAAPLRAPQRIRQAADSAAADAERARRSRA